MSKTYEQPEIQHVGKSEHRLASNPRESVFSEAWKRRQQQSQILQWLLCASPNRTEQDRDLTQPEGEMALHHAKGLELHNAGPQDYREKRESM